MPGTDSSRAGRPSSIISKRLKDPRIRRPIESVSGEARRLLYLTDRFGLDPVHLTSGRST